MKRSVQLSKVMTDRERAKPMTEQAKLMPKPAKANA